VLENASSLAALVFNSDEATHLHYVLDWKASMRVSPRNMTRTARCHWITLMSLQV